MEKETEFGSKFKVTASICLETDMTAADLTAIYQNRGIFRYCLHSSFLLSSDAVRTGE